MKRSYFDQAIGEQLFQARVVKRISQEEFCKMVSKKYLEIYKENKTISRVSYTTYESGKRSIPMGILISACGVLGLDYRVVFENAQKEELKHI